MSATGRSRARRPSTPRAPGLEQLVASHDVIVTCGSGGVGKTTTAAALAATAAAELGGRVLVVTVDPARRLATALGLQSFGNVETLVPRAAFEAAGVTPQGELWAAMLDTKSSWDDLVRRHAPDAATRDAILSNPLYRNITGTFTQSHDYIAVERLHELHASGRYDLIVVDTPPTRNAIDFLDAPARMADFFSSRLLRWLITPYRSRFVNLASKPFYAVADRVLGAHFLADIAEFFILFQSMYDGFVERAEAVDRTLHDAGTAFLVVSTLEPAPAQEAVFFCEELARRRFVLGGVVANRVLPAYLAESDALRAAHLLTREADRLADELVALPVDGSTPAPDARAADIARVLTEIGSSFGNYRMVAAREADLGAKVAALSPLTVRVPHLDSDITDLAGLLSLGDWLWGRGDATDRAGPTGR